MIGHTLKPTAMKKIINWHTRVAKYLQCTQTNAAKARIAKELQAYATLTAALLSTFCKKINNLCQPQQNLFYQKN